MNIRRWTTVSMVLGMVVVLCWPLLVQHRPPLGAPRSQIVQYGYVSVAYLGVILVLFVITAVGSILIVRETVAQYKEKSSENMKTLIAGLQEAQDERRRDPKDGDAV